MLCSGEILVHINRCTSACKSNYREAESRTQIIHGVWHHIAASYDGSVMRFYVDGTAAGSVDFSDVAFPPISTAAIIVGAESIADTSLGQEHSPTFHLHNTFFLHY